MHLKHENRTGNLRSETHCDYMGKPAPSRWRTTRLKFSLFGLLALSTLGLFDMAAAQTNTCAQTNPYLSSGVTDQIYDMLATGTTTYNGPSFAFNTNGGYTATCTNYYTQTYYNN